MDAAEQKRRLGALRADLERRGLAAYVIPTSDEYMLEYAPPCSERLAWLSGFTGSVGIAVVSRERAALFVDGRYTGQARRQALAEHWEHRHATLEPPATWLEQVVTEGERVGYDPRVHTPSSLGVLRASLERMGVSLAPVDVNLVDVAWANRPGEPDAAVRLYPEQLAGESSHQKRIRMAAELEREGLDALLVSAPDSLAWLLNIRGGDLAHTPFALGRAILRRDATLRLFMRSSKLGPEVLGFFHSQGSGVVSVAEPTELLAELGSLAGQRVRVDQANASEWLIENLKAQGARLDIGPDPCTLAKAQKTPEELAGIRAAHLRDGLAVLRFLAWLERTAPGGETELSVADKLAELRALDSEYRGPSFHTISAFGPNAALPHYRASEESALRLADGNVYLVDSGGQYLDGTTDITRVSVIGTPSEEMRRRYTQVLKGHVALARARFPVGTTGSQLDPFARQFLWQDGVDYDHGTGHGVGCYLSVHEGPHNVSKRPSDVPLRPGMIVSNEPGYYKPGEFGIRIENLVAVALSTPQPAQAEKATLGFETLTVVPYERRLIELSLLTTEEQAWIDAYHARVRELLGELLSATDRAAGVEAFLAAKTAPLRD
jgi:Xaa-Pro aminopeptidase